MVDDTNQHAAGFAIRRSEDSDFDQIADTHACDPNHHHIDY
jgi:hypothetical protein